MAAVLAVACERTDEKEPVAECEQLHQALAACSGEILGPAATQPPPVVPSTEQDDLESGRSPARRGPARVHAMER
jgi:hypothetical protein